MLRQRVDFTRVFLTNIKLTFFITIRVDTSTSATNYRLLGLRPCLNEKKLLWLPVLKSIGKPDEAKLLDLATEIVTSSFTLMEVVATAVLLIIECDNGNMGLPLDLALPLFWACEKY